MASFLSSRFCLARSSRSLGRLDTGPALGAAAALVSDLVSFVAVRLGSHAAAGGSVEHEADAGGCA
jgi:hypothetical protein